MNLLTKVLLEDVLEAVSKKITAVYGGGFKPPTKGHFDVVKLALEKNPEIDEFIVYVGSGIRDGVSQDESVAIWEIYKKYLSPKVRIEPVKSPIREIYTYAENHPDEEVFWVIGARENNPEDVTDIASRTKTLDKYPNLQLRVIQVDSTVSGTATRKAVKDNDKEQFFNLIPDIPEKEQIWDMISPVVQEILNEGRYDSLTRMVVRDIMNDWKSQYDGTPGLLEYNEDYESENSKGQPINFELYATLNVKETKTEVYRVDGGADPLRTPAYLEVRFQVDPRDLPKKWETIYNDLTDVVRHEIEHLTQAGSNVISSKEMEDDEILRDLITLKVLPKSEYFKLGKEVDAMLQGMYLKAKKSKTPFKDVIDAYFDKVKLNKKERQDILDLWKVRAKALSLPLQENIENIDYKEKIQDLTKYMLDKGMNIRPLPKVIFIKDDVTNAEDFFGKTAYYNPERKEIVLYTFGRHPKDIVRSFSHEMIHHIQNLEGRIGNGDITTTNTNEDDYLETIEKEAYLNGNIEFRKWSDSKNKLNEGILDKAKDLIFNFKSAYKDQTGDFEGFKELFTKYIKKQDLTPEEKEKLTRNVIDIFKMSAIPVLGISGTTLLGTLTNFLSKGKFSTFPSKFKDKFLPINEYANTGPATPEVYIVKADGTYKEVPIGILSKIPNLTYDMGGGETNYYPEKNIVIVDNIPVEQFAKEPGEIKDEKIYVEYNLNQPFSFPKANKILAAQVVYHLDDIKSFAKTINDSLKDGGTFQFFSDLMNKQDKEFLNYLSNEYGFGLPKNLNPYKGGNLSLKKGDYIEPVISYIYLVTDADGNTAKISVTKEGRWWEYAKIEGDIDFKPSKWSVEPEYKYNDIIPSKENVLDSFSQALKTDIVDFEKLNENLNEVGEANIEPYKWEEINSGRTTSVEFTTPLETKYEVDLIYTEIDDPEDEDMSLPALDIEFLAKPKGAEGSSSKIVVNKGELYRVMSTIVDVIKYYLRKYDIKAITYSPSKKSSEEDFGSQRDNLYRAFILKAFPDALIDQQDETIITYLPDNAIVPEGTCGYNTDVITGKKLNTPGGLEEADPKKGTGKKPKGSGRRLYTDEDPTDTVRVKFKTKEDIVDTLNKKSFKSKSHARQSQVINLIHQRVRAAYGKAKDPEVKSRLKRALDYIEKRKEASKKKTERLRKMKEASDPQAGTALPYGSGFAPVKELMTATDIICDSCGWKWAIKDGGNDLFMCHKCGHDNTPKSDPFGLKTYAYELINDLKEELTKGDLDQIERIADEWFEDYGIDVAFTKHFLDRVNDPRNGKPISSEELEDLFIKTAEKYGKKLSDFPDNFEAVLNDLRTSINLPFALNYDDKNDEMDLVAKTIMRKRDFKTTSPKLPLEEFGKSKKDH